MRDGAVSDALELLAILRLDVRPEQLLRLMPEESPALVVVVCQLELRDFETLLDLRCQQVPMLESHVRGRAFQMHERPAALIRAAVGILQTRIGLRLARNQREGQQQQKERSQKGGSLDRGAGHHYLQCPIIVRTVWLRITN